MLFTIDTINEHNIIAKHHASMVKSWNSGWSPTYFVIQDFSIRGKPPSDTPFPRRYFRKGGSPPSPSPLYEWKCHEDASKSLVLSQEKLVLPLYGES